MSKLKNWLIGMLGGYTREEYSTLEDDLAHAMHVNKELDEMIDRLLSDVGELKDAGESNTMTHITVSNAKPYRVSTVLNDFFYGANAVYEGMRRCRNKLASDIAEQATVDSYRDIHTGKVICKAEIWVLEKEAARHE